MLSNTSHRTQKRVLHGWSRAPSHDWCARGPAASGFRSSWSAAGFLPGAARPADRATPACHAGERGRRWGSQARTPCGRASSSPRSCSSASSSALLVTVAARLAASQLAWTLWWECCVIFSQNSSSHEERKAHWRCLQGWRHGVSAAPVAGLQPGLCLGHVAAGSHKQGPAGAFSWSWQLPIRHKEHAGQLSTRMQRRVRLIAAARLKDWSPPMMSGPQRRSDSASQKTGQLSNRMPTCCRATRWR